MRRRRRKQRPHPSEAPAVRLRPSLLLFAVAIALWFVLVQPPDPFPVPTPIMPVVTDLPPGQVVRVVPRDPETARPTAGRATEAKEHGEIVFGRDFERWRLLVGVQADPTAYPPGRFTVPVDANGVLLLPGADANDHPLPPSLVVDDMSWDASAISLLEVSCILLRSGYARVYFRTRDDGDEWPADQFLQLDTHASGAAQQLVFPAARHAKWRGRITGLRLELLSTPWALWVGSVRGLDYDLLPGPSPTVDPEGEWADVGLIQLRREGTSDPTRARYESRRAHPAVAGEAQYVVFRGDEPVELSFAYAPMPGSGARGRIGFEVHHGVLDERGKTWEALPALRWSAEPHVEYDGDRWEDVTLSLPALEGNNVLVFVTRGGVADGAWNGLWAGVHLTVPEERLSSVLLVTIDCLRADHVGAYGAKHTRTPTLDALAERGVRFDDCLATSNLTVPSHASILTGVYPKDHGLLTNRERLPEAATTLTELMAASGRTTIAASAVRHLNAGHTGFAQGFDTYLDTPPATRPGDLAGDVLRPGYRAAGVVNEQLSECLGELGARPFFVWAHYFDVHTPYEPEPTTRVRPRPTDEELPEPLVDHLIRRRLEIDRSFADGADTPDALRERFAQRFPDLRFLREVRDPEVIRARYRAEIEEVDRDLGLLLRRLEELERLDDTLVVVLADHGEGLGERDVWFRHEGLHEETLRVPWILAGPGVPQGVVGHAPTSTVDVVPTLISILGLEAKPLHRGIAQVPLPEPVEPVEAEEGEGDDAEETAEAEEPEPTRTRWFQHGNGVQLGFRDEKWHAVYFRRRHERNVVGEVGERRQLELYAVDKDPRLTRDLGGRSEVRDERLIGIIEAWATDHIEFGDVEPADLDDAATMSMLGYADE